MGALPWVVGLSAAAVGGALYLRARKAAAAAPPAADKCELLRAIGGEQAVMACKALRAGIGLLPELVKRDDEENSELNGQPVEMLDGTVVVDLTIKQRCGDSSHGFYDCPAAPLQKPYTLRYSNGCVPYPGHPDFARCAPGTHVLTDGDWWRDVENGAKSITGMMLAAKSGRAGILSGDPQRDILTYQRADGSWVFKGKPMACPPGTEIRGTEHRPGVSPCVPKYGTGPGMAPPPVPPPPSGTSTTGGFVQTGGSGFGVRITLPGIATNTWTQDPPR